MEEQYLEFKDEFGRGFAFEDQDDFISLTMEIMDYDDTQRHIKPEDVPKIINLLQNYMDNMKNK